MHRKTPWAKRVKKERFRKKYMTRMQCSRLLQCDSQQFRRLCILKGIYPRAIGRSKQKASGNDKQYYLTKEIKWLVHDEIQSKCFEFGAWEKKLNRAETMKLREQLTVLKEKKPGYTLISTIKERYPYFIDAVKDMDDAMSMIALYAFLSPEIQSKTTVEFHHALPSGLHAKAKDVVSSWLSYVRRSGALTKSFISVKGYYFEAMVKGERVVWIMPHEYASKFPSGVQQYIMITFLEFYIEMARFVLFKLEADLKLEETEKIRVEDEGADPNVDNFGDATEGVPQKKVNNAAALRSEKQALNNLMSSYVFYLSRETPRSKLEFIVNNCGGRVVSEFGPTVTHYVVDRPSLLPPHTQQSNVEYIQPQYVFDCLNAHMMLAVQGYRMGEELPPHVSPFTVSISNLPTDVAAIDETKKRHPKIVNYVPQRVHDIRKMADPLYNQLDPKNQLAKEDDNASEDSELDRLARVRELHDDEVSLDGDEIEAAKDRRTWQEEGVTELPERSKLSAIKVRKQRELGLMNRPTSEKDATAKAQALRAAGDRVLKETTAQRTKRKMALLKKTESAEKKMKLQVARKKAAKYYNMVNSAVQGAKRRTDALEQKAKSIQAGNRVVSEDKKTLVPGNQKPGTTGPGKNKRGPSGYAAGQPEKKKQRIEVKSPYSALPKWVQ